MERINLKEVGDLGKILQKSGQFIRQNFVEIMKSSLLIVVLPFIIGAFLVGSSMSDIYSNLGANIENPEMNMNPFGVFATLIPGYFLMFISFMIFYIICVAYIKQYVNGNEIIDSNSVLAEVKKHFLKVLFGGILVGIIIYIGFLFCLVPGIYLGVVLSHLFIIAIIEDKGFGSSFNRSFKIIQGKWWESFLLYFVASIINGGIAFIMILPMYIYMFVSVFKNIDNNNPEAMFDSMSNIGWFVPFYSFIYLIITLVIATVQTINYYSLVEGQEGIGEKLEIENIGR